MMPGMPGQQPGGGPGMPQPMMGMRPPMPQQQMGGPGMMQQQQMARPPAAPQPQAQAAPAGPNAPLNAAALAAAPPSVQKQMLGEKLYPAIVRLQPELAGKIVGMMLEMDNSELLILLESEQQLRSKVDEALRVLEQRP